MNAPPRLSMLDHALAYAARGWPVFPCSPDDKRPLVPGAEKGPDGKGVPETGGCWHATTDEGKIRAWWRTRQNAMIGVRMGGIGCIALDFDSKVDPATGEVRSIEALVALVEDRIGVSLPKTLTSETPRGGRHMLYRVPEGLDLGNSEGALKDLNFGEVRGRGGYIVVAPSLRAGPRAVGEGCDGVAYRWLDADAPIADAPPVLIDALLQSGRFERAKPQPLNPAMFNRQQPEHARRETAMERYADAALTRACADISRLGKGSRNKGINDIALGIGHLVGAGALVHGMAYDALASAASALGLPANDKVFGSRGTIERALRDGASAPADLSHVGTRAGGASLRPEPDLSRLDRQSPQEPASRDEWQESREASEASDDDDFEGEGGEAESASGEAREARVVDPAVLQACALLDPCDTDNATRFIAHFGENLVVQAQEGTPGGDWLAWDGRHWDLPNGASLAVIEAQRVGDRIALEAPLLRHTPSELAAIEKAKPLRNEDPETLTEDQRETLKLGTKAAFALLARKGRRVAFGITSKNSGRIKSMMDMAAPRLRQAVEAFNPDPLAVATAGHTLKFSVEDDADVRPDGSLRKMGVVNALPGHSRADMITALVPHAWLGREAKAPRFSDFLDEMMPDTDRRQTLLQFTALGLVSRVAQFVMFHYGTGANGKSVYLETIGRVLGPSLVVGLPVESITGTGDRNAGAASPDIARLWGKRMLRVNELKQGQRLQADLVKRLTGGDTWPVRTLFKGYYEFRNTATIHMSANDKPEFDGADFGMARRLLVMHWDRTVPPEKRIDFEFMVGRFVREEASGILAMLANALIDFLTHGELYIAPGVRSFTDEHIAEQDPIGRFHAACVRPEPGGRVQVKDMLAGYRAFAEANGLPNKFLSDKRIGAVLVSKGLEKTPETGGRTYYVNVALQNVPANSDRPERPQPDDDRSF
jgi:putative DNA primase/helicase